MKLEIKYVFTYIFIAFAQIAFGQPIYGTNQDAFVLHIIDAKTGAFIPGLKIYLTDEHHIPYTVRNEKFDTRSNRFEFSYDTLVFWENASPHSPRGKNIEPYQRANYEGLETSYVVTIPPHDIQRLSPTQIPIYMAKVVDTDGNKNGGHFPTRYYRLDYRDAVPLNQRGCFEKPQRGSYYFSIQTVTGNRFEPTLLYLDQPAMPNPKFNPTFHMYRPTIDTLLCANGSDSLYALKTLVIRNWYSLLKLKEIQIEQPFYVGAEGFKHILELSDYITRNPEGIMDFRIWIKRVKNELDQFEDYYDYYCYQEDLNEYVRNPALSDYPNIEIGSLGDVIRRKSAGIENGRIFERFYQLNNNSWVLMNEVFHIQNTPSTQQEPQSYCVKWVDSRSHLAKVYFHTNQDASTHVAHRFRYVNTCTKTYHPLPFRSSHDPYFSASKKVNANDTGYVAFDASIAAYSTGLQPITHMAYVPTADNPHFTVDIEFFVAHTEWVKAWHGNGIPSFVLVNRSDGLANALVIDEEGYPMEHGIYYPRDEKKIGNWVQYNRGGAKSYSKYGSIVHLNISWPTVLEEEVETYVYRTGRWEKTETTFNHGDRKMYIYERADSIMVKCGDGLFKQNLDYDQLSNENWIAIHLIYPDQMALPMGLANVGINLVEHTFGIIWDREYIGQQAQLNTKENRELMAEFLRRHPKAREYIHTCQYCNMFTLEHLSPLQRAEAMNDIAKDSMIRQLSQAIMINRGAITFFQGDASIRVNYNMSYAQVQAKLESYGFMYNGQTHGAAGMYQVGWPDKVLGITYIQALQKVFQDIDVSMVSSPLYFEATIDEGLKESLRD